MWLRWHKICQLTLIYIYFYDFVRMKFEGLQRQTELRQAVASTGLICHKTYPQRDLSRNFEIGKVVY